MRTLVSRYPRKVPLSSSIVTLGNFDGLHLGHTAILKSLIAERDKRLEQGLKTVLVSFYPHPAKVLKGVQVEVLSTLRQRRRLLSDIGIDELYLVRFTKELAHLCAKDFVKSILIDELHAKYLLVGPDAAVGKGREGTVDVLSKLMKQYGAKLHVFNDVLLAGERVSSGMVREQLRAGKVKRAARLLGRPYAVQSHVVHGDGRGSQIGVPTANLAPTKQLLPSTGVYACYAHVGPNRFDGVVNVGVRPTFGESALRAEVHLINQTGIDLYGKSIEVEFLARLRAEKKFSGIEELQRQIAQDIRNANEVFEK